MLIPCRIMRHRESCHVRGSRNRASNIWRVFAPLVYAAWLGCSGSVASAPVTPVSVPGSEPAANCYCYHWVHLADHGVNCFATQAECDDERSSLGTHGDQTECRASTGPECDSYACRDIGEECYDLSQ